MTTLNYYTSKMNDAFFACPDRYYSVGQSGNRGFCSHDTFTETTRSLGKQPTLARVCDSCGNRITFIKYAKYCK